MKPLNRPMFRYGGPIKEGVMSGIREPHKNGNIVGGHQSPKLAGAHPLKDASGREHHFLPAGMAIGAGIRAALPWAARGAKAAWRYIKPTSVSRNIVTRTDQGSKIPVGLRGSIKDRINITPRSNLEMTKNWMKANPGWTATGALSAYNAPSTYEGIKGAGGIGGTVLKQIADLAVPDWIWDQDKWEKERAVKDKIGGSGDGISNINKAKAAIGMPENLTYRASDATKKGGGVELSADELRKKNVERYRDIMDIKGMNKKAAYNSLIEASRLINESGDFKGDIKSGKLINQIIQGASKAYDKPSQTKDAIDTLILKGEIEKDLNKEKNALDNEYKRSAIALNEAKIAQDSLMGDRKSYLEKNKALPSGQMLAGLARNRGYQVAGIEDVTEVKNWMKENGKDEVEYLKDIMTKTEIAPGVYVINTRLIQVTEDNKLQEI